MPLPANSIELPSSYADLNTQHIKVSHVPESSPTPTPVVLLTLNRPGKNNAFTEIMKEELERVYQMFDVDERVKCVVLTGAGKMFCAGADLEIGFLGGKAKTGDAGRSKSERDVDHRDGGGRVSLAMYQCSKPTVAAIQGSAVGVGITMTLPACIRVVCEKAKIGFVFSRRGIIMEACSSFFLPRLIGLSRAIHLTTTGSVYPANHPILNTLFSEVLPTAEATLTRALEIATDIANNTSTVSTKLMRDLMYRGPDSAEGAHLLESRVIHGLFGSKDNNEGVQSFFEKRNPKFSGTLIEDAPGAYPWWEEVNVSYKATAKKTESKL